MLANSDVSQDGKLHNVILSTAAVAFLGTPHRGSPDLAAVGEWARSLVSAFRAETNSAILDALGLKTTDLERAQESFSRLWQQHGFSVKTFQEGLGLTGIKLGFLGNKVVPDFSSSLGDSRENAETLQANHMDMCRFVGPQDQNCRKVVGELKSIYAVVLRSSQSGNRAWPSRMQRPSTSRSAFLNVPDGASVDERIPLRSLWFPGIHTRLRAIVKPTEETCSWLFNHGLYQNWINDVNQKASGALLWLKGKPGVGKSTLMAEAFSRALGNRGAHDQVAAFFFRADGEASEHSTLGLCQSLLYQLLPRNPEFLQRFVNLWTDRELERITAGDEGSLWEEGDLLPLLRSLITLSSGKRILIFVDALDECDEKEIRPQAFFWRDVTRYANDHGARLSVVISSRHFPAVTVQDCPEIIVEDYNNSAIAAYVKHKFQLGIAAAEPRWKVLRDELLKKSGGVFLWVVLVLDTLLKKWDEGANFQSLLGELRLIPAALENLFSQLFRSPSPNDASLTLRLFQWAVLSTKPLRLREWHHILAFIRQPATESLADWQSCPNFTENDGQLERQIRSISRGLVEVKKPAAVWQDDISDSMSYRAGAGSLDDDEGETRIVQVIHESVRQFFLHGHGFEVLDPSLRVDPIVEGHGIEVRNASLWVDPIGKGHLSIMLTCLDYIDITELNALVIRRLVRKASKRRRRR